jgi:hypothetical protein
MNSTGVGLFLCVGDFKLKMQGKSKLESKAKGVDQSERTV